MEAVLKKVYESRRTSLSLKIISHASAIIGAFAYIAILIYSYIEDPVRALKLVVFAAVPFVAVSIMRRLIKAPRPYELYDFYGVPPKNKKGQSFPSRHVFSAFVIAALSYTVSPWLAAALLALGICLAVSRVLLGIHFIRDVVAGALIGIISGVFGIIIIL